jgi:hypothetical protein
MHMMRVPTHHPPSQLHLNVPILGRLSLLMGDAMPSPVTDRKAIAAIEAVLMLTVYRAHRAARRQLAGLDPVPRPSPDALRLHRDGTLVPPARPATR